MTHIEVLERVLLVDVLLDRRQYWPLEALHLLHRRCSATFPRTLAGSRFILHLSRAGSCSRSLRGHRLAHECRLLCRGTPRPRCHICVYRSDRRPVRFCVALSTRDEGRHARRARGTATAAFARLPRHLLFEQRLLLSFFCELPLPRLVFLSALSPASIVALGLGLGGLLILLRRCARWR